MTSREKLLRKPIYWFDHEQNKLFRHVYSYMQKEGINQTEFAKRLNVGKSYVSQIMNGNCNLSLKKWIELCLAIGIVPGEYKKLEDVIKADADFAMSKEKKTEIKYEVKPMHFTPYTITGDLEKIEKNDSTTMPNNSRITIYPNTMKTNLV